MPQSNIGELLSKTRVNRGYSIEEAAEQTHIRAEFLRAIESGHFDEINLADVYKKGFLKIYSRFLHLDPKEVLKDFKPQQREDDSRRPIQKPRTVANSEDAADSTDVSGVTTPGGGYTKPISHRSGSSIFPKNKTTVLIVAAAAAIAILATVGIVLLSIGDTPPPTPPPPSKKVADYATTPYVLTLMPLATAHYTITSEDKKTTFVNENLTENTNKKYNVHGPLEIACSAGAAFVRVQIGRLTFSVNKNSTNATSFIISVKQLEKALAPEPPAAKAPPNVPAAPR